MLLWLMEAVACPRLLPVHRSVSSILLDESRFWYFITFGVAPCTESTRWRKAAPPQTVGKLHQVLIPPQ